MSVVRTKSPRSHPIEVFETSTVKAGRAQKAGIRERLAEALRRGCGQGLTARNLKNFRHVALAYPKLDPVDLSRHLGFSDARILPAPAESYARPFPRLATRASAEEFPWWAASWMARLFTTLTFAHLGELSRTE